MKQALFIPCFLALIATAGAESNSLVSVKVRAQANSATQVTVRNDSASPVTALAFSVGFAGQSQAAIKYVDFIGEKGARHAVAPGEQYRMNFGSAGRAAAVEFKAAIFADGTTSGDSGAVDGVLQHRRAMLQALNVVLGHMPAATQTLSVPQLIAQFHSASREQLKAAGRPQERLAVSQINLAIDRTLQRMSSRQPREALAAVNGLLTDWQNSLSGSLPSIGRVLAYK